MFAFLRRLFRARQFAGWSIDHDRGGYRVGETFVARSDVAFIIAYKRDLVTIDQICIGLGFGEPDEDQRFDAIRIEEDNPIVCDLNRISKLCGQPASRSIAKCRWLRR